MPDSTLIPDGPYCYRLERKEDGFENGDVSRYGMELREFSHHGPWKAILCPYWQRTAHGTIRCEYIGQECLDEDDREARDKSIRHFTSLGLEPCLSLSWLADECKICGVRGEVPDDGDDLATSADKAERLSPTKA